MIKQLTNRVRHAWYRWQLYRARAFRVPGNTPAATTTVAANMDQDPEHVRKLLERWRANNREIVGLWPVVPFSSPYEQDPRT